MKDFEINRPAGTVILKIDFLIDKKFPSREIEEKK